MHKRLVHYSGFFGIIAPVFGFSTIFIAISTAPWFSWTENALSDLGVKGLTAIIFNGGLIVTAIMLTIFGIGIYELTKEDSIGRSGLLLFISACIFLMGIGLFPETAGRIHFYFSVAFFVTLPISCIVLSIFLLKLGKRELGILGIIASIIALTIWTIGWDGVAIPEAVSAASIGLWSTGMGVSMIRRGREIMKDF